MKTIHVLIVEDQQQVYQGLATVLALAGNDGDPRIEVIGFARNSYEAVIQTQILKPDVILMDMEMPGLDGCSVTRLIKAALPAVRVIILSIHNEKHVQQYARAAGADGFVVKGSRLEDLLQAVSNNATTNITH